MGFFRFQAYYPNIGYFRLVGHNQAMQDWRYEIKMVGAAEQLPQIRSWVRLHPSRFVTAYLARQVNSLYFDTPHLNSFEANMAGISARQKLRLRWYGNDLPLVKRPMVELKYKENMLGGKRRYRLQQELDFSQTWRILRQQIEGELVAGDDVLHRLFQQASQPTLLNHYWREYYVTADGRVRVTLDYKIVLYDQRIGARPNYRFALPSRDIVVVEFKTDQAEDALLQEIVTRFPLKRQRNSKYANGILASLR